MRGVNGLHFIFIAAKGIFRAVLYGLQIFTTCTIGGAGKLRPCVRAVLALSKNNWRG